MDGLTFLAIILLLGTLGSIIAIKLRVSNVFFLVFIGMVLGIFKIGSFPKEGIVIITMLGLVMIVFTGSSKFKIKELLKYSPQILKLDFIYLILTLALLSVATYFLFDLKSVIVVLLFSALVYSIDPAIALSMLISKKGKISKILEIESILNTPIIVIVSLALLNLLVGVGELNYIQISGSFWPLLKQFLYAIAIGLFFGFLVVSLLKKSNLGNLNYIIIITSAIVTYVLAEYIKGNGVLAVTVFGIIFGNYHLKKKLEYEKFISIVSDAIHIVVFILIGTIIVIPVSDVFIIKGSLLFLIYLLVRFLSVQLSLKEFRLKEKIFMCLNVPKGVEVAVIILIMISGVYSNVVGIKTVINLCLLFILYSIVLSTIVTRFAPYFLSYDKNPRGLKHVKKG